MQIFFEYFFYDTNYISKQNSTNGEYWLVLIVEIQCIIGSHKLFLSPFALMQKVAQHTDEFE